MILFHPNYSQHNTWMKYSLLLKNQLKSFSIQLNIRDFQFIREYLEFFQLLTSSNHVNSDLLKMMMKLLILSNELSLELEILCFEILFNQQILLSEEYSNKIELLKGYEDDILYKWFKNGLVPIK
jgi:hypothetical protein